jgi:hypothetical protein
MGFTDGRTFIVFPSLSGSVFAAPGDPASGQIIGRKFNGDFVSGIDPDEVHPHFTGNMSQNLVSVLEFHLKHGVRQSFNNLAFHFNNVAL